MGGIVGTMPTHPANLPPKVSVCVITYNQERFIGRCLQSIADQETDFHFDIIVGVDPSADKTAEIVSSFAKRYPDRFKPLFHEECLAIGCNNYRVTHQAATGEYVAHIDGDDVMLPGKLQAQADFLDQHPECSLVAHKLTRIDENDQILEGTPTVSHPRITDLNYLLQKHTFFSHSSKMYRRASVPEQSSIENEFFIDFGLHIEMANWGPIGFLNEPLGLYRVTRGSNTKVRGEKLHRLIDLTLEAFSYAKPPAVKPDVVGRYYSNYAFASAFFCLDQGGAAGFLNYIDVAHRNRLSRPSPVVRALAFFRFSSALLLLFGRALLSARKALRKIKHRRSQQGSV